MLFFKKSYLSVVTVLISQLCFASPFVKYESAEHINAGDKIKLYFDAKQPPKPDQHLNLPNGLALTYGEIIALPDFYEIVGKPISDNTVNPEERKQRFLNAFNSLSMNATVIPEAKQILEVIHDEQKAIETGMEKGEKPEDIYKRIGKENNRKWNCITGGGCDSTWWLKPGRYLKLATQDFSHFGNNAWLTYKAGHELALDQALKAHKTHDVRLLELAYALNGFANHYLSDRFATGHMRTLRVELPAHVTPSLVGAGLVSYMHNEENQLGLHVHNANGDQWMAYGDDYYFSPMNATHRKILEQAMQESADQIFNTYLTGQKSQQDTVYNLLPLPNETGTMCQVDVAPLFVWDEKTQKVLRRDDLSKPYSCKWTANWVGWVTLIELARLKGVSVFTQAQLAGSNLKEPAIQEGLL